MVSCGSALLRSTPQCIIQVLHNTRPGIQSSGLGGSATATTAVCILANELAGHPMSKTQLISMASRMEHDLEVSITGTQEQSNVLYGGVTDYVWFPWGIPGEPETSYGSSLRTELIPASEYGELESRVGLFHSGRTRPSTGVNAAWRKALSESGGYRLHKRKLEIAYEFREGLRLRKWNQVADSITAYRDVRTRLCGAYMDGANEIQGFADAKGCATFPVGTGGGGSVLVFAPDPDALKALAAELREVYRPIPVRIRAHGYQLINFPLQEEQGQ